jgi:hypothetical protein
VSGVGEGCSMLYCLLAVAQYRTILVHAIAVLHVQPAAVEAVQPLAGACCLCLW